MIFRISYVLAFLSALAAAKIDVKELKCLVCKATVDELNAKISKLDPDVQMEIGGYKIDTEGNLKRKTVSQAQSEVALSEAIDEICEKMDDYVRARWKSNGRLTLIKMILPDNSMNPDMSAVEFVQDDDLNKSLKYYCEEILEMHEDNIIKHYINDKDNIKFKVCVNDTKYCDNTLITDQVDTEKKSSEENIDIEKILQEEKEEL